ncbi:hypothetical protein EOL96_03000 [Candidatus Saccharibacteria bacterium]|nr:hypothetical protein [Candidatus Saccharibacteria bacterium]
MSIDKIKTTPDPEKTTPDPELDGQRTSATYEIVASIDTERGPAFNAMEQIKGVELAKLFLSGYADRIQANPSVEFRDGETPLDVAAENMRHIAGYYIIGGENAGEQLSKILKPWQSAYEALKQES